MKKLDFSILSILFLIGLAAPLQAQQNCPLACNDQTIVVLDSNTDLLEVLPTDILAGDYSSCANFSPVVNITDFDGILHPTSPSVGSDDANNVFQVTVTNDQNACWGTLRVFKEGPIDLKLGSSYAPLGGQVCIPLNATNFVNISNINGSINWDPNVLKFKNIEEGGIWASSVNLDKEAEGKLGFDWINNGVAAVNWVPNNNPLLSFCFETLVETSSSEVCIGDDPTAISIVNYDNAQVDYSVTCSELQVAACKINCLPDLTVILSSDEERTLASDYTLLRGGCNLFSAFTDLTLSLNDASGTDLGTTLSASQAGQIVTATVVDNSTGNSCTTKLTVEVCNSEPVNIEIAQRFEGSDLIADLRIDNAVDISGYQFTLDYDPDVLQFESFITGVDQEFSPNTNASISDGKLLVLRPSNSGLAVSFQDGEVLMSVKFSVLSEENTTLSFGSDPLELMFVDDNVEELCVNAPPRILAITGSGATGKIYDDVNQNCIADSGDLTIKNWLVEMVEQSTGASYYTNTDEEGNYLIYAPQGSYTVTAYSASEAWSFCDNGQTIVILNDEDKIEQDFHAQAEVYCPEMSVDLSTPFLRRCFNNTYHLSYCNDGTVLAEDAYITVELDPYMNFVDSSFPHTVAGQVVTFDLGDVPYGDCGELAFTIYLDCASTTLGQTHCLEAQIFPVVDCFESDPEWSGASLDITGECNGQTIVFTITNVGIGDMSKALDFIVTEDDVMREGAPVQLGAGEAYDLAPLPADGSTYRISIPQVDKHPGKSTPTVAVEGCGTDSSGSFSTGFVNMFSHNDGNGNVDIDCEESIGSWDPNDKAVAPKGYTEKRYVSANIDLDYKIRFQNTGTDTAFRVIVRDVIEEDLDLSTLQLGAASHNYKLTIEEGRTLVFTFDDIKLVDSTRNEAASHGFIKFKIAQLADKPDGTFLTNDADIYFDFNEAVETNTTELEIGAPEGTYTQDLANIGLTVFPNPTPDQVNIRHSYRDGKVLIKVYDQLGKLVLKREIQNDDNISLSAYPAGLYEYRLTSNHRILATGKISKI